MKFQEPLLEGILLKRYKRFFADIKFENKTLIAHVPNTGSLLGVVETGAPCRFTMNSDPNRKLKATLQMIQVGKTWVGVNTQLPNKLVLEAYENNVIEHWRQYDSIQPEYKLNAKTRLDFALFKNDPAKKTCHFVEVKSVTMAQDETALFPDAVTSRGLKHLQELEDLCKAGHSAEMLYLVQRNDCRNFDIATDIDAEYGEGLLKAKKAGLIVSAYTVRIESDGIELDFKNKLV